MFKGQIYHRVKVLEVIDAHKVYVKSIDSKLETTASVKDIKAGKVVFPERVKR